MYTILTVMGTRPEAIKLFPLIKKMESDERFHSLVASTGQQGAILGKIVKELGIKIDYLANVLRHDLMPKEGNDLLVTKTRIMDAVGSWVRHIKPDLVVVHGDTATASAASTTSCLAGYPVAHVEAGNRSGNKREPFPEEIYRRLIANEASLHFASTQHAKDNLMKENISERLIHVTGSTVIDAMQLMMNGSTSSVFNKTAKKQVLVTMHRKENLSRGAMDCVAESVKCLLDKRSDVSVKWSVPANPKAIPSHMDELAKGDRFEFLQPQKYRDFLSIVQQSSLVICDSGGLQEEAYVLGIPTIIARNVTERPEALNESYMALVSPDDPEKIFKQAMTMLDDNIVRKSPTSHNFGQGNATDIIVHRMFDFCNSQRDCPKRVIQPEFCY